MDGLSAIAKILKLEGVEWVACYPSNNLIEAVAMEGIRTVMFRHERGAVMAADGYSRANNRQKFGVVITQGASGAENAMGGIAQAFGDMFPFCFCRAAARCRPGASGPTSLLREHTRPYPSRPRLYSPRLRSATRLGAHSTPSETAAGVRLP